MERALSPAKGDREQLPRRERSAPDSGSDAAGLTGRSVLSLQALAGNAAVSRLVGRNGHASDRSAIALQRQPPPTQAELDDVVDLMPIMGDLDALVTAVESECALWRSWRGTLEGRQPGAGAFAAMDQFKTSIRSKGFDWTDDRIQRLARRRVTGDNRQLLTEMCSFALGTSTRSGGDFTGLARLCGVETKVLTHRYALKVGYSIQVKGKLGIGVGYTYRSAAVAYSNDFGMTYNKPLNMSSGGVSVGPAAGAKVKGKEVLDLPATGAVGLESEANTESLMFWMPDDFETTFSVVKVAGGGTAGLKYEVKLLELVRVSSDKHPPLLFDLMGGQTIAGDLGFELGAEIGAGTEIEMGVMRGGPDVGKTEVGAPALDEARKNAEKAGLTTPDPRNPDWEVVGATVLSFDTGKAFPTMQSQTLLSKFAAFVARWARENEATDIRFEVIGQASPRWRHPKKGQVRLDLNQKLSEERAEVTKILLIGDWADQGEGECSISARGCAGPEQDMDDDRASATGKGSHQGLAETGDPDNDDAVYRVASITAWGKRAPAPAPATPPPLRP